MTRVFISHSRNGRLARRIKALLEREGLDVWLDYSDIRVGALLGKELRRAIKGSRALLLLWSKTAAASPWVATEILAAFHLNRYILPCVLGDQPLPPFLGVVYLPLKRRTDEALLRLVRDAQDAPRKRNDFSYVRTYQSQELEAASRTLNALQHEETDFMQRDRPDEARKLHAKLDIQTRDAEKRWPYDPIIASLGGYHYKNAYLLKYWEQYNAGIWPQDRLLADSRQRFFKTLFVNPIDYNSLNGLGNVLLLESELDAAELFTLKAIEEAARLGIDYGEAKNDLKIIRSRMGDK
jgi:hypothetical protein